MIDFYHISNVISKEITLFTPITFLSAGVFLWLGHIAIRDVSSTGAKLFWFLFACFLFHDTLKGNEILFSAGFYISIAMFFTHSHPMFKNIRSYLHDIRRKSLRQRKYEADQIQGLKDDNRKLNMIASNIQNADKVRKEFLEKLSNKLDMF